jgi:HEPN domain-containing protein
MKNNLDLVRGWLQKAENDITTAINTLETMAKPPLDTTCFHAQQSVEKYLKAFLTYHNIEFPFTHELGDLSLLCSTVDKDFLKLIPKVKNLIPYAVDIRYPDQSAYIIPQEAQAAVKTAKEVKRFVLKKLPKTVHNKQT